jgi:hypothetical protein
MVDVCATKERFMGKVTVPNIGTSKGIQSNFDPLAAGKYVLKCIKCSVNPPKNPSPCDVWGFKFDVLEGPPQENGKPGKGRKYNMWVTIKHPEHPRYKPEWDDPESGETQFSVDQLKSMMIAMGVKAIKGDVNPDSFAGTICSVELRVQPKYNNPAENENNPVNWAPAE